MQLNSNEPVEVVGNDWTAFIGPALDFSGKLIDGFGGSKKSSPPPPPPTPPWLYPTLIGGGAVLILTVVLATKR